MGKLISTQEAAEILQITRRGVLKAIHRGDIKAQRIGRTWAVDKDSLSNYTTSKGGRPTHKKKMNELI